jgi:hypothetical protein
VHDAIVPTSAAHGLQGSVFPTSAPSELDGLFEEFEVGIESKSPSSGSTDESALDASFEAIVSFANSMDADSVKIVGGVPLIEEIDDATELSGDFSWLEGTPSDMIVAVAERNADVGSNVHDALARHREEDDARMRQIAPLHATIGHYKRQLPKPPKSSATAVSKKSLASTPPKVVPSKPRASAATPSKVVQSKRQAAEYQDSDDEARNVPLRNFQSKRFKAARRRGELEGVSETENKAMRKVAYDKATATWNAARGV